MRAVRRGGGEGIMVGNLVLLDLLCFLKLHSAYKKGQGLGGGISQEQGVLCNDRCQIQKLFMPAITVLPEFRAW